MEILNNQIAKIHHRSLTSSEPFLLEITDRAKQVLVEKGTDPEYGARPLTRVVEKYVVTPISGYICGDQIKRGDLVMVDHDGTDFIFQKEEGLDMENEFAIAEVASSKWAKTDLGVRDDGGAKKKIEEEMDEPLVAGAMTGAYID